MSEIKVQCDCGQKLKFDVDPSYTRIPFPVNCPVCGADCSDKANQLLGALVPAPGSAAPLAVGAPSVPTGAPRLRIGASVHAPTATAEAPPAAAPMPSARPGAFPGRPALRRRQEMENQNGKGISLSALPARSSAHLLDLLFFISCSN